MELQQEGYWEAQGVEVIGVDIHAIHITEDRQQFRDLMERIGVDQARSQTARSLLEAKELIQSLGGLPVVIRPSFTLGGAGGGHYLDATGDQSESHARARIVSRT